MDVICKKCKDKMHKKGEVKHAPAEAPQPQEAKTEEQKTEEKEKEKSTAIAKEAEIKQDVKAEKHSTKPTKAQRPQRMALQK